jgi:N4-gp56 family major capsid protein
MTTTNFGSASPQTVQKWSTGLWIDQRAQSYFEQRFIGTSNNSIIQRKTELESGAGDQVKFDLCVQLRGQPTDGDDRAEGTEENQKFYQDQIYIDQVRKPVSAGGEMTRKRTVHDLRSTAKELLADYFARLTDELFFMYLGGGRGMNEDFIRPLGYQGFASNPFQAPDADHLLYGGAATSKATLAATDKINRAVIERALNKAEMMQARNPDTANMVPVKSGSEGQYVFLMNPDQEFDLRNDTTTGSWLDLQKAAAAAEGSSTNAIFKGNLGMLNGAVLHKHRSVIRFNDYGAGANVNAARAMLLGRQAAVVAYGTSGGMRYTWKEKMKDYDNEPTVAAGCIFGVKKTRFNGKDFGVLSIDTAAKDPNAA